MKDKISFNCIRDYYLTIKDLYESCENDDIFYEIFKQKYYDKENLILNDKSKMRITNIDDMSIIVKAKYCLELSEIDLITGFVNAPKIAGNICRDLLLGNFKSRTLTPKQKEIFVKSTHAVDFSNLEMFDLRKLCDPNFVKDKTKKFY